MVSVQPQLSLEVGWTLDLLFLIFHRWQGLKEGCPTRMQQKGENPNEGIYPICQHCLVSQLQAGHVAELTDKKDDSNEKFQRCLDNGGTDTVDIFTIAHFHRSFAHVQKVETSDMYKVSRIHYNRE